MRRLVAVLLAVAWCSRSIAEQWPKTIGVCELLTDPLRYNGKMVAVRGRVVGTGEGEWLIGEGCSRTVETGGYKWPTSIWLATSYSYLDPLHEINFRRDETAFTKLRALLKAKGYDGSQRLVVTYLGLFETYDDLASRVVKFPDGALKGAGFGHQNSSPAQLIIKTVSLTDVRVGGSKR